MFENQRPEGGVGLNWAEDTVDDESVGMVGHEGEDVAGKDSQARWIWTPC